MWCDVTRDLHTCVVPDTALPRGAAGTMHGDKDARAEMIASGLHSRRATGISLALVCLGVVASVALLSLPTASPRLPTPSELVRQSSAARSAVAHDLERGRAVPEVKADVIMEQDGDRPGGGFLSSMLRRMEGLVPSTGAQQQLARKWWECGGHACEHAQAPALPAGGIHMGALDRFRKKNCGTAECIYANAATGFNVPGTGVAGHRWASSGHLAPGAAKENVGEGDHVEDWHTGRFVVDETSLMYVMGTKIDWIEETFGSQFEISNPNSTSACGCGESFGV